MLITLNGYTNDLLKSILHILKDNKKSIDINNLLLMYDNKLISETELNNNSIYKKYIDDIKNGFKK